MGNETGIWDDSALINAFNKAISKYKMMHSKGCHDNSTEGGKVITTAEDTSDRIDGSQEDCRQMELHDNDNDVSNTEMDVGKVNDLPQSQESYHVNSHAQGAFMQTSNFPYTQNALDGISYSQDVGEYSQLLNQYYELEEQRQKVLQHLHQAGYWNNQDVGKGSGSSAQWGVCSTSQEQHQVTTHQSSLPGMLPSCCPYVCPCLVAPCSSLPCCASSGTCVSNIGTASCTMGPQKSSSLEDDGVVKTAMGAAERAISSIKMMKSDASTIHEGQKEVKKGSSLSEGEMVQSMDSDTDLGVVLHAWYSAGFYTGKYLKEQSKKGWQGHETELIKLIVTMVLSELKKTSLVTTGYAVGILDPVKELLKLLDVSSQEVRIVGIHGMGGIGKTTIAKAVYNEISCHFEYCSFLEDVRETSQQKGLVQLQKHLISKILKLKDVDIITSVDEGVNMIKERCCNKKVLIVLDDVDNLNQLKALANKRDWFGLGSRIIITTRDKHILNKDAVDEVYVPGELSDYQSLKLFSMHAFRKDRPPNEYYGLSSAIACTAGGLPLALEVLGSHLSGKHKAVWEETLKKLTKIPHHKVQKKLRISYDELEHQEKQIFLDIACFFDGMNKRIATYIWEEYFPHDGIDILLLRSLVKIGDNNELRMHSQLRDLGKEIVHSENFYELGERSRLWFHDDAWEVLKTYTGTRKVQGLRLDFGNGWKHNCLRNEEFAELSKLGNGSEENFLTNEEFAGMSTLRLLQIDYAIIAGDFKRLLSKLRWLSWKGCPYNFTATNFHPEKLIVLDLSQSKVTEDWEGWIRIKMAKKLKVINLSGCCDLIKTPDFSAFPSLVELILEDCRSLVEIDTSIGCLRCLVFLNVKDCKSLLNLPIGICELNSLESLIVSGCIKLSRLPTGLESLKALRELRMDGTSLEQLSDSIPLPKQLEILSARDCRFLTVLPTSIRQLRFLTDLALDRSNIIMLPDSIGSISKLRNLSLSGCRSLRKIPDSVGQLESLVELNLKYAGVTEIPGSIGQLKSLMNFYLDETQITELPDSIGLLVKLEKLSLGCCKSLRKIPDSIGQLESLVELNLNDVGVAEIPDSIGHLKSILEVTLTGTQIIMFPDSIGFLLKVRELSLGSGCRSLKKIPDSVGQLQSLVKLKLVVIGVTEIPDSIGSLPMLEELSIQVFGSLRRIPDSIGRLESLRELELIGSGIIEIPDAIGKLKSLEDLKLDKTHIIELPDSIGYLSTLQWLSLKKCGSLKRIPDSIGRLESLCVLDLSWLGIIEISDAIGELKSLQNLVLNNTHIIELPESIGSLSTLQVLALEKCGSLRRIPNSIGRLESLLVLNLTGSAIIEIPDAIGELKSLEKLWLDNTQINELPDSIGSLSMLKLLSLRYCGSLRRIPDSIGRLELLGWLHLTRSGIIEIPQSIGLLSMLKYMSLEECGSLRGIPDSIGRLESLRELNLIGTRLMEIPDTVGQLKSLTRLQLDGIQITELPDSIWSLSKLECLSLMHCRLLRKIPDSIGRLKSLYELKLDTTGIMDISNANATGNHGNPKDLHIDFGKLPHSLTHLTLWSKNSFILGESISSLGLQFLSIRNCRNHPSLLHLPSTLSGLHISGCAMETLPNFSNVTNLRILIIVDCVNLQGTPSFGALSNLEELKISNCRKLLCFPHHLPSGLQKLYLSSCMSEIQGLERMEFLTSLDLSECRSIEKLPNMSIIKQLKTLILRNCEKLCDIEGLERLELLKILDMSGCISLEKLPNLSNLIELKELRTTNCKQLIEIQGISELRSLKRLDVSGCISLERSPNLSNLIELKELRISDCKQLLEIQGISELRSLKRLDVSGCMSLERLPNFSNLIKLKKLWIRNCKQLIEIQGINELVLLKRLDVSGCVSLERLPNLSNLIRLKELWIRNCKQLIEIPGINKGVRIYGRSTICRHVKIKSATGVKHLKIEKFTEHRGIKRFRSLETHQSIKRFKSLETLR